METEIRYIVTSQNSHHGLSEGRKATPVTQRGGLSARNNDAVKARVVYVLCNEPEPTRLAHPLNPVARQEQGSSRPRSFSRTPSGWTASIPPQEQQRIHRFYHYHRHRLA